MTSKTSISQNVLSRKSIENLIDASINVHAFRFARQVSQKWLELYPNDLLIQYLLAKAYLGENNVLKSRELLLEITQKDPEFSEAFEVLAFLTKESDRNLYVNYLACVKSQGLNIAPDVKIPEWSSVLLTARQALHKGSVDEAESLIFKVLGLNLELPLPAVMHMEIVDRRHDEISTFQLARIYHSRWPKCIQFKLHLANSLMKLQDEKNSLSYLNDCVNNDIAGQVSQRLWGKKHKFSPLWPENLKINFQEQIPAEVNSVLGKNLLKYDSSAQSGIATGVDLQKGLEEELLKSKSIFKENQLERLERNSGARPISPGNSKDQSVNNRQTGIEKPRNELHQGGDTQEKIEEVYRNGNIIFNAEEKVLSNHPKSDHLIGVEQVFQKLAKKYNKPEIGKSDNRFPMVVLMSSKIGLKQQYGDQTTGVIEKEMRQLADEIRRRPGWGATVFFPDEKASTQGVGISPINKNDPLLIKNALVDLDRVLSKKGEKIGALVIVGGPNVIPYHTLTNPTDDADTSVFSDNPYATIDSNNFINNWPIGRITGETGTEPGLLILQLRNAVRYHKNYKRSVSWWNKIELTNSLLQLFGMLGETITRKGKFVNSVSFGYTASVWKDSSKAVFRVIGDPEKILISPPAQSGGIKPEEILAQLGYFNLHGLEDTSSWYGQRDLTDTIPGPDYPVALTPGDLVSNNKQPKIVFSEACYGGHILNKRENESIALKFLAIGTPVFIGSTGISYGSVTSPLIGADFLTYLFWFHMASGFTAGEALLQARVDFVREMHTRQGFLDGEDQKTLLSFVLYGDPMARMEESQAIKKFVPRYLLEEPINTICDRCSSKAEESGITNEIMNELKQIVEMYLPGMDEAEISISNQHKYLKAEIVINENGEKIQTKSAQKEPTGKVIVSFKKQIKSFQQVHRHFATATLDSNGKMIKLALSK